MIAHVAIDVPVDGHFDYAVPENLQRAMTVGLRVKVPFVSRVVEGYVIAVAPQSDIQKLKSIKSIVTSKPIFDERDIAFANVFSKYYGCSFGEALVLILRHRKGGAGNVNKKAHPLLKLYHCVDGIYHQVLDEVTATDPSYMVLVADMHAAKTLGTTYTVGLRSTMFDAFTSKRTIIVVDEDNESFKQEQSPMYDTAQVLLMAQAIYGFDLVFIGQTPSVELMRLVGLKKIEHEQRGNVLPRPTVIDLSNYKFLDKGIISAPLRNAIEANLKVKKRTMILFNRRGTFAVTRCGNCGYILKCRRCDRAMSMEKSSGDFVCRHCSDTLHDAGKCPQCGLISWKSFGMGIEKVEKEISALFPTAKVVTFAKGTERVIPGWDVLVATTAILAHEHQLHVETVAVVEIDSALDRLDMRSTFKTWRMLKHLQGMGNLLMVQTRNWEHPMMKALSSGDDGKYYAVELGLREELNFSPFYHWVAVVSRSQNQKNAKSFADEVYNYLYQQAGPAFCVTRVMPDNPSKLRDQYRFRLMAGGPQTVPVVAAVKAAIANAKRTSGVIVTLNIDP